MAQGKKGKSGAKAKEPTEVVAHLHDDKRRNIPTSELAHMVEDDERKPKPLLYQRRPELDPQLVWNGKDELDLDPLEVPAVPIYIQEKIDPRVIVENLRKTAQTGEPEPEMTLFADFDGLDPLESVEFYEHDGNWSNRMILGDSLLVMASLAEKENLRGKVQMIYVDPPYGIKFGSNWQVSTRKRDVKDGKIEDASREPEVVKAFRDTWERGIHSYLMYLRDRFVVARDLLTETGSIFVQIGDENVHLVRSVLDEIFGSENFVNLITFKKTSGASSNELAGVVDYILWYGRDREHLKYRPLFYEKSVGGAGGGQYTWVELESGERRRANPDELRSQQADVRFFRPDQLTSQRPAQGADLREYEFDGARYSPGAGTFKTDRQGLDRLAAAGRLLPVGKTLTYVRYLDDFPAFPMTNLWDDTVTSGFADPKVYVVQTHQRVPERCMLMTTDPGDLVLDPTCGSGTTAYVAERWGRRWITIDTSRVAFALARTRLMAARYPYYVLADSEDGAIKEADLSGQLLAPGPYTDDLRKGFVYKRVPHIMLSSITNNPEIRESMTSEEIDEAIRRHSDQELLYDQPYEDRKKIRVSGRFTVESLSPHRVLEPKDDDVSASVDGSQFEPMVIEHLRKAGVQNTYKGERLEFDRLEPYAGEWIQADGEFTQEGEGQRVAIAIGPEHGTVGPDLIRDAAIEAGKAIPPYDLLVVTGFAFDPHAWETAKEITADVAERKVGRVRVLLARANPDLAMGGDLLKATGSGNLFMVFGEPDIEIRHENGEVAVEIKGLDVYDPTTGEVRSSSTKDIAAWFIDSDYDDKSFFVRHAYFTGGHKPYESLQKALRAEIDEDAWASLYSTVSRPFPAPSRGKIAVKVINHYGDEVMQVYEVRQT